MRKLIANAIVTVASIWALAGAPVAAAGSLTGTVVDADSDAAVKRAIVLVIDFDSGAVDVAVTDRSGSFTVDGLDGEEFSVVVIGPRRYESGYVGCALDVVPTFGEACTFGPGDLVGIELDRR